jgi:hypothetical protein
MADEIWTRERLDLIIYQKIEENHQLDYKAALALGSSDGKKDGITKDVSAFANSAGGRIIYGIKEFDQEDKKHLPEKIDPIDGRAFAREWLDQIIGQINPRIDGVRITPVRTGPEDWETCYVVDIPKGETAHQARDLRYYRRYNFESVPMADHEIRDVMNRRKFPKLDLRVRLQQTPINTLKVLFRIKNLGKVVPQRYATVVLLPTTIRGKLYKEHLLRSIIDGKHFWRFMVVGDEPAFPEADAYCDYELPYAMGQTQDPVAEHMLCTLYADEMPPVQREIPVESALAGWV